MANRKKFQAVKDAVMMAKIGKSKPTKKPPGFFRRVVESICDEIAVAHTYVDSTLIAFFINYVTAALLSGQIFNYIHGVHPFVYTEGKYAWIFPGTRSQFLAESYVIAAILWFMGRKFIDLGEVIGSKQRREICEANAWQAIVTIGVLMFVWQCVAAAKAPSYPFGVGDIFERVVESICDEIAVAHTYVDSTLIAFFINYVTAALLSGQIFNYIHGVHPFVYTEGKYAWIFPGTRSQFLAESYVIAAILWFMGRKFIDLGEVIGSKQRREICEANAWQAIVTIGVLMFVWQCVAAAKAPSYPFGVGDIFE
ncbi:unnamed protein product [Notodromas monacha]|uniref:Uncharacterized protein n=1 Tax=Notodromas monacha TaxID=399045 RepID=A0A7R9BJM4_9CRUS|nr:unnamed protein product [Notodromas monacha]CAG0916718.1 unnamed protein product [Notodromas monacha]